MIYDFIEIGTSDFRTLIETAKENEIGLSIEPISFYLDNLPNKKNVKKANYAMSDKMGSTFVYYVKPNDIAKHNLPYWVRGCNSINEPHPSIVKILGDKHDSIVTKEEIKLVTWEFICKEYEITGIKYLKIDTEGHDSIILDAYYEFCKNNPNVLATEILFEYNVLSDASHTQSVISKFLELGYVGHRIKDDYKLTKK